MKVEDDFEFETFQARNRPDFSNLKSPKNRQVIFRLEAIKSLNFEGDFEFEISQAQNRLKISNLKSPEIIHGISSF